MEKIIEYINRVLIEWDPIGVGEDIAIDEYSGYIPSILKCIESKQELMGCLEDLLTNKIGISYDATNQNHISDLQEICDKLIQAYRKSKCF